MKRVGYLYDKMIDRENVRAAILKASKGKRNRRNVKPYVDNIEQTIDDILELLPNWIPAEPVTSVIYDEHRKKYRTIAQPVFYPDQIIHHMYVRVMEPVYMHGMYDHSYGSIPKRGTHKAIKRVYKWLSTDPKNTKYCGEFDIKLFYAYIIHAQVASDTGNRIKDVMLFQLTIRILMGYHQISYGRSVPIGFYTSQWFANFYLQELDHVIKERFGVKYYVRYMDNLWIFGPNKRAIHKVHECLVDYIAKMGLSFNNHWQVYLVDSRPVNMLGYRIYRDRILLGKDNYKRVKRCIRRAQRLKNPTERDLASLVSYKGLVKHTTCNGLYKELISITRQVERQVARQ